MRSRYYYLIAVVSLLLILVWLHIALIWNGLGGIGAIFVTLATANLFWLLPAFGLFGLAYILRAIRWWLLLRPFKIKKNPANVFPMLVGGIFLTYVVPLRAGDIATPFWLRDKTKTRFSAGLASIILVRFLDFASLIIIILVTAIVIFGAITGQAIQAIIVPALLGIAFIAFFVLIRNNRFVNFLTRFLSRLFKPSARLKEQVPDFVENFALDLRTDVSSWNTGGALLLSVPLWVLETMKLTFLGLAFGINLALVESSFIAAISYTGGHALGLLLPAGIAIFVIQFFTLQGLMELVLGPGYAAIAASIALLDGLVYVVGLAILGVPSIASMGRGYRELQDKEESALGVGKNSTP